MKKSNVKVGEVSSLSRKETKKNKQNSNKKIRREGKKREWEIISMDSNKHMGYAFQWFSMAIALFILVLIFIMRKKK